MLPTKNPSVGDVDTMFAFQVSDENGIVDLSGTDSLTVTFRLPDLTTSVQAGVFVAPPLGTGDGRDGQFGYAAVAGFLSQAGKWERQGLAHWPDGRQFSTSIVRFLVDETIAAGA